MQKTIDKMTGYKSTDKNMKCRGFQFELNKWYEHKGELELCKSGFHFCVHPSGPWCYYDEEETRVFRIEAEEVLDTPYEPGSSLKKVCRRIRLVEEITLDGYRNTGDGNTGYRNTGDGNTGDRNTGDGNTGDRNTGDRNTGDGNTGDRNTGYRNTGNRNTGDGNTGDGNTGNRNTGDGNTGHRNTGDGNTTNNCAGFFCSVEPKVLCFDVQTEYTKAEFQNKFPQYYSLSIVIHKSKEINFRDYAMLPGITPEKLKNLHQKTLAAKKNL